MHPFRFAVHTGGGELLDDWPAFARRAESLGDTLELADECGRGHHSLLAGPPVDFVSFGGTV